MPERTGNVDAIPETLRERDAWVCWRVECRDCDEVLHQGVGKCPDCGEKATKVPVSPEGGYRASSTDPSTWADLETALTYHRESDATTEGIGYVFHEDGLVTGVDLDNVRDPETGALEPWAADLVDRLDSWTEISVSGTGLHVYALGFLPDGGNRRGQESTLDAFETSELEMYDESRFFVVTGNHFENTPETVAQRNGEIQAIHAEYIAEDDGEADSEPAPTPDTDLDDQALIEKATNAENADKFEALWNGDTARYESHSEADLALCSLLAFWTGGDPQQIDHLFRKSDLCREKWTAREDYRERTIDKALDGTNEFYDPSAGEQSPTEATSVDEVQRKPMAEADGGVAAESPTPTDTDEKSPEERAREKIEADVLIPFDPPEDYEREAINKRTAVDRTANIYHEEFSWIRPRSDTRGWRATLYNYVPDEGIYEPHGEAEIERMIDRHLGPVADNQFVNEVVGKVKRKARIRAKHLDEPPERVVVENGILDLTTGDLHDHTPAEFHRTKLDVEYPEDGAAGCPKIDEFFHDIVREKDVPKLYRFIAHSLYRGYPEAKAAMLLGAGENGKSTFLNLIEAFLGDFNVSNEPLKKLNEHEWAPARLNGKLANVVADMSDQSPDSMGMFKQLTGGDTIPAEVKFEEPVEFTNTATLIFACNEMPVLHHDTHGNWRRWQLIKFPYTFNADDPDAKDPVPEAELRERVFTDEEFAGLLARCVEEISAWADGRDFFPDADDAETTRQKMRRAAEPVYDFAHVCLRPSDDEDATLPKEAVREAYRQYATLRGLKKLTPEVFGERLLNLTDFNIDTVRIRDGQNRVHAYSGIEFTERGRQIINGNAPVEADQAALDEATAPPDDADGNRAARERLQKSLRQRGGDLQEGELLAAVAEDWDMDPDTAQDALEKGRRKGDFYEPEGGLIRLTDG